MFIYLVAIIYSLVELSNFGVWLQNTERDSIDAALMLALVALLYLAPFTLATLKSLEPTNMARRLARRDEYESLDELMRRAVNEGIMVLLNTALTQFTERVKVQLDNFEGEPEKADELSGHFLSVGRHSCQRISPDAVESVMYKLTELIAYCNEPPRYWRQAADVFNEAFIELYMYSEHWLGRSQP